MKQKKHKTLLQQFSPTSIIDALEPFVTQARQQRIKHVISGRLKGIQLAIECPSDINNALAAIRSCEAMGISTIHIIDPEGDARYARSVTQGAVYWVNLHFHESLDAFLSTIRSEEMLLAGAIMGGDIELAETPIDKPICYILGNEQRGLSQLAIEACDILYRIPMVGMSESMNLSVCAAITIYDTSTRKRKLINANSDLSAAEQLSTRARYYLNSVNPRIINNLLK